MSNFPEKSITKMYGPTLLVVMIGGCVEFQKKVT